MNFNISIELLVLSFTLALIVTTLRRLFFKKPVELSEKAEFILEVIKDGCVTTIDGSFTYIDHENVLYRFFVYRGSLTYVQVKNLQYRFNRRESEVIVDTLREKEQSQLTDTLNILRNRGESQ